MKDAAEPRMRRASPELVAVVSLGVTILLAVLGQAAWLDGKIERVDAKLGAQIERVEADLGVRIESLQTGQAAIRERLAALEVGVGMVNAPATGSPPPTDTSP